MSTRARDRPTPKAPDALLELFGVPLLDALDDDATSTRRTSARALVSIAASETALVEPLATSIVGRLPAADHQTALLRTLATLAVENGDAVAAAVRTCGAPDRLRRAVASTDPWTFEAPFADGGHAGETAEHGDVGALVRQVVETESGPSPTPPTPTVEGRERDDPDRLDAEKGPTTAETDPAALQRRDRIERIESSRVFRAISLLGDFDELSVVEPEQAVRYGSSVRTRARRDGTDAGVAVRLFDRADAGEQRREFSAAIAERLACWAGLDDHDAILSIHDWGERPRPWVATRYVEGSLADRGRPTVDRALEEAIHLVRGVEHCHANGVVHTGIDPETVVYPDASLDGLPAPRLDNVGLLGEFRRQFDPAAYLDPPYAAPEYFERRYGRIDQATDVYQLGATVFRLCTGRPPYTGSYDDVRRSILESPPPTASDAADLPTALDPVFTKALARDKLTRYETVTAFRAELEQVRREIA